MLLSIVVGTFGRLFELLSFTWKKLSFILYSIWTWVLSLGYPHKWSFEGRNEQLILQQEYMYQTGLYNATRPRRRLNHVMFTGDGLFPFNCIYVNSQMPIRKKRYVKYMKKFAVELCALFDAKVRYITLSTKYVWTIDDISAMCSAIHMQASILGYSPVISVVNKDFDPSSLNVMLGSTQPNGIINVKKNGLVEKETENSFSFNFSASNSYEDPSVTENQNIVMENNNDDDDDDDGYGNEGDGSEINNGTPKHSRTSTHDSNDDDSENCKIEESDGSEFIYKPLRSSDSTSNVSFFSTESFGLGLDASMRTATKKKRNDDKKKLYRLQQNANGPTTKIFQTRVARLRSQIFASRKKLVILILSPLASPDNFSGADVIIQLLDTRHRTFELLKIADEYVAGCEKDSSDKMKENKTEGNENGNKKPFSLRLASGMSIDLSKRRPSKLYSAPDLVMVYRKNIHQKNLNDMFPPWMITEKTRIEWCPSIELRNPQMLFGNLKNFYESKTY